MLDAGEIGASAATAFMVTPGPSVASDREFYYRSGGGPLLDMGPCYLTSLVTLLGPVRRVVGCRPRRGKTDHRRRPRRVRIDVEVATHVTGVLEHEAGPCPRW